MSENIIKQTIWDVFSHTVDTDLWAFIFTFVQYFVCSVLFIVYVCTVRYCFAVSWRNKVWWWWWLLLLLLLTKAYYANSSSTERNNQLVQWADYRPMAEQYLTSCSVLWACMPSQWPRCGICCRRATADVTRCCWNSMLDWSTLIPSWWSALLSL